MSDERRPASSALVIEEKKILFVMIGPPKDPPTGYSEARETPRCGGPGVPGSVPTLRKRVARLQDIVLQDSTTRTVKSIVRPFS